MTIRPLVVVLVFGLLSCGHFRQTADRDLLRLPAEANISFALPGLQDSAWLEVYVPPSLGRVRAVIAFVNRELDQYAFDGREWRRMCSRAQCALLRLGLPRQDAAPPAAQLVRNAGMGGGAALLQALAMAAAATRRSEIRDAPVLLFGFSAAGNFGPTFASWRPDRTIGFIRYHSNLRGITLDTAVLANIPALTIVGSQDEVAGSDDSRNLWEALRARNAPWAYVSHIGQPHFSIDGLVEAGVLMREWAESILALRLASDPTDIVPELRAIRLADGLHVDDSTKTVSAVSSVDLVGKSWLPDIVAAQELRVLAGMCAAVPRVNVTRLLGADARIAVDDVSTCRYSGGSPSRDVWLSTSRLQTARVALAQLDASRRAANGGAISGVGDAAFFVADSARRCSTVGTALQMRTFFVSLCGDGFGAVSDSSALRHIAVRMLGMPERN